MLVESPDPALALPVPGQKILVGGIELEVTKGCTRCVMTTRAQPGGIERQLDILRHVIAVHDNQVGFRAAVTRAGAVRVGDTVTVTTSTAVPAGD